MSSASSQGDPEKGMLSSAKEPFADPPDSQSDGVASERIVDPRKYSKNPILRFNYYMEKLGGETQGADQIPEDARYDDSHWNSATMWLGANLVIAAYALGMLGIGVFGLKFWDSVLVIIFFGILGCVPVATLSTFGPPMGLRQQVLSRYWFGTIGARLCCCLTVVSCVGWSSVNTIAAANSLHVVNYGGLSTTGGILIISFASWVISLFGYRIIHAWERWAWLPNLVVLLVICIALGISGKFHPGDWNSGPVEAASVLSFGSSIYGFAAGWGPYASDYTAYRPKHSNKFAVFSWIIIVESISVIFPMIIGAASAATILYDEDYANAYNESSTGGLLWMILVQDSLHGFGQFCIVVFALSTISNNIPNIYTFAMAVQSFGFPFYYLPQWLLTGVITGIAIGIAIPGAQSFSNFLQSFMDLISYWISFYYGIILCEHLFFRRGYNNYRVEVYDQWRKMPLGLAGTFAIGCGVAGFILGMDVTFYLGVIAQKIGDPTVGGDIGWELSFGFGFCGYLLTRWAEFKWLPDSSYNYGTRNAWWRLGGLIPGGDELPSEGEVTIWPNMEEKVMRGAAKLSLPERN